MSTAASFEHLTVRYGDRVAVADLSLTVEHGAVTALLGRNGAGKSSAMRCLLGEQSPHSGRVRLFDCDAFRERASLMRRVGVVPEEPDAPPRMTPLELGRFCHQLFTRWDEPRYLTRLARFGVPTTSPFATLSKGQRAQVMLALALGHDPELLILDDPTLGLDVVARRELFEELVADLHDRGTTVIMTTHDLAGIERLATHVAFIRAGRLTLEGELETVRARVRVVSAAAGRREELASALQPFAPLVVHDRAWGPDVVVTAFDANAEAVVTRHGFTAAPLTLEEMFLAFEEVAP